MRRARPESRGAAQIGEITAGPIAEVVLVTGVGTERLAVLPEEDPLPRIC